MSTDTSERDIEKPVEGRRVISGIGWSFFAVLGEQMSTLVAFVIIARILGPAEFGIVVLAVALIDILVTFVRAGISEALIRIDDLTPEVVGTGFWVNMLIACTLGGGLYLLAPEVGELFDSPQTVPLMQAMTVVFPIAAMGSIAEGLLSRRMAFAAIARRQIIGSICGAMVSIALALNGYGLWAMIGQRIIIFFVGTALAIWAAKFIPPMQFSIKAAKKLLFFGGGITSINVIYRLQPRAAELVIGFLAQPVAVALYRAAYRVVDLVNQLPMQPLMRVTFPTLSRLVSKPEDFRAVLLRFMEGLQIVLLPIYAGIGYFSADIFHALFGTKWDGAVTAFTLLLVAAGFRVTFILLGPATSARGSVHVTAAFSALDVALSILLMIVSAPYGINAVAGSRIAGAIVLLPFAYFMLLRPAGLSLLELLKSLIAPISIMLGLVIALKAIDYFLLNLLERQLNLVIGIPICGILYFALVITLAPRQLRNLLDVLDNSMTRKLINLGVRAKVFTR